MSGTWRRRLQIRGRHFRDWLMMHRRRSVGGIVRRLGADWLGFRSVDAIGRVDWWGSDGRYRTGGSSSGVPLGLQNKCPHQEGNQGTDDRDHTDNNTGNSTARQTTIVVIVIIRSAWGRIIGGISARAGA
jgi:hypothetical protein